MRDSNSEYEHLDSLKSNNNINRVFADYASLLDIYNPNTQCEAYLKEKVTKLQSLLSVLNERKRYVKSYVKKIEMRNIKAEKLNQA